MSRLLPILPLRLLVATLVMLPFLPTWAGDDKPMRVDARLIWGTNDKTSPDTNHTAVSPELAKRFQKTFKWKHYFLVNKQHINIAVGDVKALKMSEHCTIEVRNLGDRRVQVKLVGDGKAVGTCTQQLPEDKDLVMGGDAQNDTAWFVILRSTPKAAAKPSEDEKQSSPHEKDGAFNSEGADSTICGSLLAHCGQVKSCTTDAGCLSN